MNGVLAYFLLGIVIITPDSILIWPVLLILCMYVQASGIHGYGIWTDLQVYIIMV